MFFFSIKDNQKQKPFTMLPAQRLITSYNIDDRLILAITRRDLTTVRYILESNFNRSMINQNCLLYSYRNDFNHPITPLGIINTITGFFLFFRRLF